MMHSCDQVQLLKCPKLTNKCTSHKMHSLAQLEFTHFNRILKILHLRDIIRRGFCNTTIDRDEGNK